MNRTLRLLFPVLSIVFCCHAQQQPPQSRPAPPDGGTPGVLVSIYIPNIPDAPFTATVNTEWVRALSDGTRITLVNHRLIARDSAGRIFQERRLLVPQNGKQQSIVTQTEISDPILKQQYICFPNGNVCQLEPHQPFLAVARHDATANSDPSQQSLGTQTVGGLETLGTRETTVIPAGEIGNDSAINTTREYWFSPKLGFNLVSVRDDPRFGTQRFELSDITLGDPDPKLFSPPEGSRIVDLRHPPELETPKAQN
jgi:hypothetical protein